MAAVILIPMLYTTAYGSSTPAIISSPLSRGSERISVLTSATPEVKSIATQTDGSSDVTDHTTEIDNGATTNATIRTTRLNGTSRHDNGVSNATTYPTRSLTGNASQGSTENTPRHDTTANENITAGHLNVNLTELTTKTVEKDPNWQPYNLTFSLEVYETCVEENTINTIDPDSVSVQTSSSRRLKAEWLLCIPALITCVIYFL